MEIDEVVKHTVCSGRVYTKGCWRGGHTEVEMRMEMGMEMEMGMVMRMAKRW